MIEFKDKQRTLFNRLNKLRLNATKQELIMIKLLQSINVKFIFQKGFIKGNFYCIVDFYLPKYKLVIEVDGGYHFSDEQRKKDYARDKYLKEVRKFKVMRLSNKTVEVIDANGMAILLSKV